MESTAKLLEDNLLMIWNERNAQRRLEAMKEIYATDIALFESNEGSAITGCDAINDVISQLQQQWPLQFTFQINHPARVNHGVQYLSWSLGISTQKPAASGTDIAIIEGDKIKSLHAFLNTPNN